MGMGAPRCINEAVIFVMAVKTIGARPQNLRYSRSIMKLTLTPFFDRPVVVQYQWVPVAKQWTTYTLQRNPSWRKHGAAIYRVYHSTFSKALNYRQMSGCKKISMTVLQYKNINVIYITLYTGVSMVCRHYIFHHPHITEFIVKLYKSVSINAPWLWPKAITDKCRGVSYFNMCNILVINLFWKIQTFRNEPTVLTSLSETFYCSRNCNLIQMDVELNVRERERETDRQKIRHSGEHKFLNNRIRNYKKNVNVDAFAFRTDFCFQILPHNFALHERINAQNINIPDIISIVVPCILILSKSFLFHQWMYYLLYQN